jgi:hypothetical protein
MSVDGTPFINLKSNWLKTNLPRLQLPGIHFLLIVDKTVAHLMRLLHSWNAPENEDP